MELHLKTIGLLQIALALLHAGFPRRFDWRNELASLSLLNRQMMYVHTLFIAITLALMGLLCVSSASELITTALGRKICLGLAIFWIVRLLIQFFGYSSKLWKGKRFETTVHVAFSVLWIYIAGVYLAAGLNYAF
jgi:hypothetical protein